VQSILDRFKQGQKTRVVAFGSSNTERRTHGLHWFDWLDLGLKQTYGRVHHCINAGLGGDTTRGLLQRFDEDVALYQPHVVFVTIGGNDSKPESGIDDDEFHDNLLELARQIRMLGAAVVLQTYYSADIERLEPRHGQAFLRFMDVVRQTAAETGADLVDHHRRWEPLRAARIEEYRELMIDPLHVNSLGNMLVGLDLIRAFRARLDDAQWQYCARGRRYQLLLDALQADKSKTDSSRNTRYQGAIIRDHHILLIKHRQHDGSREYWVIPGGGQEPGETEEQCVQREMKEETYLDVRVERLLLDEPAHPESVYKQRRTYLCVPIAGEARPGYEPELDAAQTYSIADVAWFDLRDQTLWGPLIARDPYTYPQLLHIRAALGYT
jgi:ADP-ribose pyrophosphatase YjhB (NUDIX family)/lysophospholipase L1-like esterase